MEDVFKEWKATGSNLYLKCAVHHQVGTRGLLLETKVGVVSDNLLLLQYL